MSIYIDAADAMEREQKRLEGLAVAAKVMRELGALDQVAKELTRAKTALMAEVESEKAELAKATAEVSKAKTQSATMLANADEAAGKLMESTRERCAQAEAESAERIASAKAEASARAGQSLADADHRMQAVMQSVQDLRAEEDALKGSIAAKAVQLGTLEAKMAAAREAAAAMLA